MSKLSIGVVGNGVVGSALAHCYKRREGITGVPIWDINPARNMAAIEEVLESDLVFVCIPETALDDFFDSVPLKYYRANFVIKSTCPIGTTRRLKEEWGLENVCHSPEFLTAKTAHYDATHPQQNVIGFPGYGESRSIGACPCASNLHHLYSRTFPDVRIRCMSADESEALKLFINATFAVKVSLFNEFNLLVTRLKLDWQTILDGMIGDERIGGSHTQVPGPDGMYGFGNRCLPKDLTTVVQHILAASAGGDPVTLVTQAALTRNLSDRKREVK